MKKLLYSAAVLALTFLMSGCSLEETPLSKFDEGPSVLHVAIAPLSREDPVSVSNNSGCNPYYFHV